MERRIIAIDSHMLEMLQLCARKYYYAHVRNIGEIYPKEYLDRGSLVHFILDKFNSNGKNIEEAIKLGYDKATELNLSGEECDSVFNNLRDYADYTKYKSWRVVTVEQAAAKILYEDENFQFLYQAIIDLTIEIPGVSEEVIVDFKHAKRRGSSSDLSNQFIGYCWIKGVHNIIKAEIGFQKTLKPSERFREILFSYSKPRIEEWVQNATFWLKQLTYFEAIDEWPMNWSSCNKFDGCIFSRICSATPDAREHIIKRDYVTHEPWDAGKRL